MTAPEGVTAEGPEGVTVDGLDGPAAGRAEGDFALVYAEAFSEPPYRETRDDVTAAFRRFRSQTRRRTFRAALARTADGTPVGMAYGYVLGPGTGWWDSLTEPVSDEMRREDGHRTFGLMELAVRPRWRGQGVARRLHETLLGAVEAERVLLDVHPASAAAQAAYRSWGYRKVGEAIPWDGAALHDVLVLDLSPGPARDSRSRT
ncbi:GNAT family N-acetyltransferase [Streptomyces sennicomposti]|uniref:GNAT family N-acetyltransferase n=1 Tax=Streptomyces sennicomposti TaxID=2873384 RepID=UPI0013AA2977|nr:GNAT family N-acetyltransferase [Streptomyces sennicomposti]MBY8869490.1 GNAT family N-acetyltransferase [Streptomyces sennicomposti]MYS45420.1 GNAT family N-acetyltransferase [Streptomyces sp. SID5998]